ncbi:MAG: YdbC family protein [Oscillospiraceae bacterium]|nr:YdbC family protein [Oscillospiraceae bacterium]
MAEFTYEIVEELGVLSETTRGWTKELNLISWNGREPKYDIREWAPAHEKMGKGVTLSGDEAAELKRLLALVDFDSTDEETRAC